AQGAQLLAPVLGDLVRPPRRHPDPVDPEVLDDPAAGSTAERRAGLVLDDIGERARRGGERHIQRGDVVVVHADAVDQAKVASVEAELRVDDVLRGRFDVGNRRLLRAARRVGRRSAARRVGRRSGLGRGLVTHADPPAKRCRAEIPAKRCRAQPPATACAVASLKAIQDNRAHFTRAGYLETPAKAMPSSSSPSSGSPWLRPPTISVNASTLARASVTVLPTRSSYSTLADAWLMEQPIPS